MTADNDDGVPCICLLEQTTADLMGHGNVTTFKKIYRHRLNPVVAEAAGIMNDIWGNGAAA